MRKETTISSLKKRTTELKNIIDDMHATFSRFSDDAALVKLPSLSEHLAARLHETEQTFSLLREKSRACFDEAGDSLDKPGKRSESPSDSTDSAGSPSKKRRVNRGAEVDKSSSSPAKDSKAGASAWGYEILYDATGPADSDASVLLQNLAGPEEMPELDVLWSDIPSLGSVAHAPDGDVDRVEVDPRQGQICQAVPTARSLIAFSDAEDRGAVHVQSLKAPYSYAHRESSFARQLHRTTLETACHLIQERKLHPGLFRKKFQLCQPYGDGDKILEKIIETLRRPSTESLDWRDHPLQHLGGAGTHFMRRPASGASSPSDKAPGPAAIGASELAALMNSASSADTTGKPLSIAGFEGEWFDASDVEGYLEERGIHFEPGSKAVALQASSTLLQPQRANLPLDSLNFMELSHKPNELIMNSSRMNSSELDARPDSSASNSDTWDFAANASVAIRSNAVSPSASIFPLMTSQRAIVDVQKLIRELVKCATCLGRCPGYRRRDVDRAFNMSVAVA